MKEYRVRRKGFSSRNVWRRDVAVLGSLAFFLSGCAVKRKPSAPSIPWNTAVLVRPGPPHLVTAADLGGDPLPELQPEAPAFPLQLIPEKSVVRPRVVVPTAGNPRDAEKAEAPMIAPQLSPQESVTAQMQTSDSLSVAEKNLASVRGKRLNSAQSDLVSKIQEFIKDARDAVKAGDWALARSLAKKAQVLSEELVGSS
jgi:hypothetical protein